MSAPLVWLPFDIAELGDHPGELRYETVDHRVHVPESIAEVEFFVPPYLLGPAVAEPIAHMSSLRVVQALSAGVDAFKGSLREGITLCSGRGIHDSATSELALALILASLRGVPRFVEQQQRHVWQGGFEPGLADKRVLIVGYGSIGSAIEKRLLAFETEVVRVARTAREGVHSFAELPALLPTADVVVLILPLTDESRGMVDAAFLASLKDGALLVNVARGPIVDNAALVAELESGRLQAAIDVADVEPMPEDHPFWSAPNLLVSPHVGGATDAMWPRAHALVREQLFRFAAGEPLANVMAAF